ncbi:flagellar brake protein [Alteribacter keqinensis]|uniref:flagellar brake protein n=1 Tax=Alteribacter keqinensis TaxID=2483800 RepID=UPI0016068340|nr:PilZ domain-containing protein [Alteribacter keqinensis]
MISVGDTIYLEINNGADRKRRYRSKVTDFNDTTIYIQDIPEGSVLLDGILMKAWFLGKDEAIYLFETAVTGKMKSNAPVIALSKPDSKKMIRIQRRQYVRVEAFLDVAVYPYKTDFTPFTTISSDISGGGLKIELPEDHELVSGNEVLLYLPLCFQQGETEYCEVTAEVLRISRGAVIKASLSFKKIKEKDRQKLIRFCYEKQVAMRHKEKSF